MGISKFLQIPFGIEKKSQSTDNRPGVINCAFFAVIGQEYQKVIDVKKVTKIFLKGNVEQGQVFRRF